MIVLKSAVGNYINIDGVEYSYFAGNNYLGMANHPVLKQEAVSAIEKYGINFSASRETTGTSEIHLELEKLISEFKNKDDAVIFPSGYMGNKILLNTLKGKYSAVFYDELSHPSIYDGIPAEIKVIKSYQHLSAESLEETLKKNRPQKPLIFILLAPIQCLSINQG